MGFRYRFWIVGAVVVLIVAVLVLLPILGLGIMVPTLGGVILNNIIVAGTVVALVGVIGAQHLTVRRYSRALEHASNLEAQRAHEAAIQKYFEQVGKLLIDKPLRDVTPDYNLSIVVRAQTLAVLEGLDPDRKRILLQFLQESALIRSGKPVISLQWANLRKANLSGANLSEANLSVAILNRANLRKADLSGGILSRTLLSGANLSGAVLSRANLSEANLSGALLSGALLKLANLSEANLIGANLGGANLSGANLVGANLSRAILNGADLSGALLVDASITEKQLAVCRSLEGATMPDGSKHD